MKIGLDQYGTEPFEQQRFETAGVEGVNLNVRRLNTLFYLMVNGFNRKISSSSSLCVLNSTRNCAVLFD